MQISSEIKDKLTFLTGNLSLLENITCLKVHQVFDDLVVNFFDALSNELMHDPRSKQFSDVISYAFWIRKSSLLKAKNSFLNLNKLGRGVAFHIAPSNVPINFAVSMTSALLAGNSCVIRVSNKDFAQVNIVTEAINKVLAKTEFVSLQGYIITVRYERDKIVNDYLSSICDLRIVWGGDRTIEEIRKSSIPARAIEMTFADRYSIAIINADEYLKQDPKTIAQKFYIDTYFTDQNACSSPRLVVWTGDNIDKAQEQFWSELSVLLKEKYQFSPILAIDKLNGFCNLAIKHPEIKRKACDNELVRVQVPTLYDDLMDYKLGGGYFFEYQTSDLSSLVPILKKPCQTISYLGIDPKQIYNLAVNYGVRGVDRIVPLGKTMELEFYWDGYQMIDTMSRYIDLF